ncbi:MAG TPA: helix-turn-helix transcriptional regulator [Deltaproteobacteria bacterium]|nr:helix-turn-helix transcriptional regulator [Deltaproteobacteria bacterium]
MGFKEIGRKIQKAREETGLTQVDLAQSLGITQAALSNYELGKRRLYLHQIEDIARVLQKSLDYFIPGPEKDNHSDANAISGGRQKIISRIGELDRGELDLLTAYLDFLEWRKHHD